MLSLFLMHFFSLINIEITTMSILGMILSLIFLYGLTALSLYNTIAVVMEGPDHTKEVQEEVSQKLWGSVILDLAMDLLLFVLGKGVAEFFRALTNIQVTASL